MKADKRHKNYLKQRRKEDMEGEEEGKKVRKCSHGECFQTNDRVVGRTQIPNPKTMDGGFNTLI